MSRLAWFVVSLPLVLGACSAIPPGRTPGPVANVRALELAVVVGQVRVDDAQEREEKGYPAGEVADPERIGHQLARWLHSSSISSVESALAPYWVQDGALSVEEQAERTLEEGASEAWNQKHDLLLEIALKGFQTRYEGHNGWYLPNIGIWFMWFVPSFWVATEEYSLSFTSELTVYSADSSQEIYSSALPIRVEGTFNEFDRGWQPLGFLGPLNDGDNWSLIAQALLPAAVSELGEALVRDLDEGLRPQLERKEIRDRLLKTQALLIGVSTYAGGLSAPYAGRDVAQLKRALDRSYALRKAQHIRTLTEEAATREAVNATLADLLERHNQGDQLILYFAGIGSRDAAGYPILLLSQGGHLSLQALVARLEQHQVRALIVVDAAFDGAAGQARSRLVEGSQRSQEVQLGEGITLLFATGSEGPLYAPSYLERGLFTHHLVRALEAEAGAAPGGSRGVPLEAVFRLTRERTVRDSSFEGGTQRPVALGLDSAFLLPLQAGR